MLLLPYCHLAMLTVSSGLCRSPKNGQNLRKKGRSFGKWTSENQTGEWRLSMIANDRNIEEAKNLYDIMKSRVLLAVCWSSSDATSRSRGIGLWCEYTDISSLARGLLALLLSSWMVSISDCCSSPGRWAAMPGVVPLTRAAIKQLITANRNNEMDDISLLGCTLWTVKNMAQPTGQVFCEIAINPEVGPHPWIFLCSLCSQLTDTLTSGRDTASLSLSRSSSSNLVDTRWSQKVWSRPHREIAHRNIIIHTSAYIWELRKPQSRRTPRETQNKLFWTSPEE